jgi:hypothetical protein
VPVNNKTLKKRKCGFESLLQNKLISFIFLFFISKEAEKKPCPAIECPLRICREGDT